MCSAWSRTQSGARRRRTRHRAAALPRRAGAQSVPAVADAAGHFRLRRCCRWCCAGWRSRLWSGSRPARAARRRWRSACRWRLSSTAQVLPMLQSAGRLRTPFGERAFSILLFQDLSIVPLITIIAAMCRNPADAGGPPGWLLALYTVGAIVGLVLAGRFILRPLVPADRQSRRARDVRLRRPCSRSSPAPR